MAASHKSTVNINGLMITFFKYTFGITGAAKMRCGATLSLPKNLAPAWCSSCSKSLALSGRLTS